MPKYVVTEWHTVRLEFTVEAESEEAAKDYVQAECGWDDADAENIDLESTEVKEMADA